MQHTFNYNAHRKKKGQGKGRMVSALVEEVKDVCSCIETVAKKNYHRWCWLVFGVDELYSVRSVDDQQNSRSEAVPTNCYTTFLNCLQSESFRGVSVKLE